MTHYQGIFQNLLVTKLIFCKNPKANGKFLLAFCRGNQLGWHIYNPCSILLLV